MSLSVQCVGRIVPSRRISYAQRVPRTIGLLVK